MDQEPSFPAWNPDDPLASTIALRDRAEREARERSDWYERKSRAYSRWARAIRVLIIVAVGLGGLGQLLGVLNIEGLEIRVGPPGSSTPLAYTTLSYIAFALAAALFGLDKFFGFSSGWIRFIMTKLALERLVAEFDYDFASLRSTAAAGGAAAPPQVAAMLQRIKDFALAIESAVKQETDAWAAEFQDSMAEMQKMVKTELEKRQPGSVKVVIADSKDFDRVEIYKDGAKALDLTQGTEGSISNLAPGPHTISAAGVAKKDGSSRSAAKVVEVQPGAMVLAELTLGP